MSDDNINRTTDLSTLTEVNPGLADVLSSLLSEYTSLADTIDSAKARQSEIMAIVEPLTESAQLKSVKSDKWTLSRTKGRTGATSVYLPGLLQYGIPAEALVSAIHKIDVTALSQPKLVTEYGVHIEVLKVALEASSSKAPDGQAFYTVRRKSDKNDNGKDGGK